MDITTLGLNSLFELGESIINRIWPDETKRAEQLYKLEKLKQDGRLEELRQEVSLLLGQLEINKKEAEHSSIFVAGWRPFVGWVGGFGFAYMSLIEPLLRFILTTNGYEGDFPEIDTSITLQVLLGMLGLGAMRSYDKLKGVATRFIEKSPKRPKVKEYKD